MVVHAVYENGVFRPVGPVELPENCEVALTVSQPVVAEANDSSTSPLSGLAELASAYEANPESPTDLARQHDHYLYGTNKQP